MAKTEFERKSQILYLLVSLKMSNPDEHGYYIPPNLSKRIHSLYYIEADIERAQIGAQYLIDSIAKLTDKIDPQTSSIYELIWHGIVINYSRCFANNKGGFRKLEESIFADSPELLIFHKELINLRNSYVAHRDDNNRLEAAIALFVSKNDVADNKLELQVQHTRFDPEDLKKYIQLFHHASAAIDQMKNKELQALQKRLTELERGHLLKYELSLLIKELAEELIQIQKKATS